MTDGVLTLDWPARCPAFAPATTEGFAITGTAFVTGNGSPAPFGNPTPFTVCVLGGASVKFSNMWYPGKPAPEQCEGCTFFTTQVRELSHLHVDQVAQCAHALH